eukprot:SAG31_NODE_143_length_22627_cov_14.541347_11_plen_311_part_00
MFVLCVSPTVLRDECSLDALRDGPGGEARCATEAEHIATVVAAVPSRSTSTCPALLNSASWTAWRNGITQACAMRIGEAARDGGILCTAKPPSCRESLSCCGNTYDSCRCEAPYCFAPTDIFASAVGGPCVEGDIIAPTGKCTTRCAAGYIPTANVLICDSRNGTLSPPTYSCVAKIVPLKTVGLDAEAVIAILSAIVAVGCGVSAYGCYNKAKKLEREMAAHHIVAPPMFGPSGSIVEETKLQLAVRQKLTLNDLLFVGKCHQWLINSSNSRTKSHVAPQHCDNNGNVHLDCERWQICPDRAWVCQTIR